MEEEGRVNGFGLSPGRRGSDWGRIALLEKTKEFFRTCDVEGKGFITRTDMRRLHRELPLSAEELEDVFDSLDTDHTGYLTLEAFSSGFSRCLLSKAFSLVHIAYYDLKLKQMEDEEEGHFCMLLESLGASNVFEDPGEVRSLWAQLRRDEPHLLSNFEEFLARVTHQIKEAHQDKKEMESALQRKAATHDSEIRHLYEEMEAQIKNEKDRLLLKDSERLQLRSHDLEHQLYSKEKELDLLFQKQKRLENQCHELSSEKQESHVENVKLKMTNDELSRALENTSQELALAQEQLGMLQEQAARLHQEKEMEMYRVTEGLQREKQSLMKQLDLLSAPACQQRPAAKKNYGLANGYANPAPPKAHDVKAKTKKSPGKMATAKRMTGKDRVRARKAEIEQQAGVEEEGLDAPPDGWPLRRVISIEEDHLAHLLHGGPQPLLHQLSEEEDESEVETSVVMAATPPFSHPLVPTPLSPRGQPVGKETQQAKEGALFVPDRLFKVVLIGNSSVGKTSLLRSFCEGRFHPSTTATVGIDYSVKTLTLDNMQVAMQLWDTAGQERYRSITKQFFRKADGVVVMYDVTVEESFKAVQPWLTNVQEAAGEGIPILLLGNKMDMDGDREVSFKEAEQLAHENKVMFFEVSAYTAKNVTESLTHLARVLMDQEDKVRDTTVILSAQPVKKKACCK
uniref:Calcium release activated channel regulator 2Ab n=1 Tax=Dicentrarchus labrax TaxID=13489 RepID=A0A8C4NXZ2_DICLA